MLQIIPFFLFAFPRWSWTANLITIHVVSVGITTEFRSTTSSSMEVGHPDTLTVITDDRLIVHPSTTGEQTSPERFLWSAQNKHCVPVLCSWSKVILFWMNHLVLFSAAIFSHYRFIVVLKHT